MSNLKWAEIARSCDYPQPADQAAAIAALNDAEEQGVDPDWVTGIYISYVAPEAGVTYTTPDGEHYQTSVQVEGTRQRDLLRPLFAEA